MSLSEIAMAIYEKMRPKRKKQRRHFVCFYVYTTEQGWGQGRIGISADGHVNANYAENYLRDKRGLTGVSLTNVIELSERDYHAFFAEEI